MPRSHLLTPCLLIGLLSLPLSSRCIAQAFTGYTLYGKNNTKYTYLVDMNNQIVKTWNHSKTGGYSAYLLPDGSVIRTAMASTTSLNGGGAQGVVQRYSWSGALVWEYTYASSAYRAHHDIEPLPNGNILMIAWESKTAAQCVQAGLDHSASIWPDHLIEVEPVGTNGGNIVWEWHAWDHLIQDYNSSKSNYGNVGAHPELLDINMGNVPSGDWMHINAVSYNPTLDQIVISSHNLNEIYVIDHSTTTAQAASHSGGNSGKGGDILYRWGNPANYRASGSRFFDVVHCSWWIPQGLPGAGNILAYNNRASSGSSQIVELVPPGNYTGVYPYTGTAYGPASPTWSYSGTSFFSNHLGGCQRLPNGNTLIAQSTSGKLFEVNAAGVVQWSFTPGGEIPRALRYDPTYTGLSALPVDFTSFRGAVEEDRVHLSWTVAREEGNYGFHVERRNEEGSWVLLGFVPGRGSTELPGEYEFVDATRWSAMPASRMFYRLRQVDIDGSSTYSPIVEIASGRPLALRLHASYPCPASAHTGVMIPVESAEAGTLTLMIQDNLGRTIRTLHTTSSAAGLVSLFWDGRSALGTIAAAGVYRILVAQGDRWSTGNLIMQ